MGWEAKPDAPRPEAGTTSNLTAATVAIQLPPLPMVPASALSSDPQIVAVALNFQGRRKCVRHLENTSVGELVRLHLSTKTTSPLIVLDKGGFEIGKELT